MERTGIIVGEMGDYSKIKLMRHTACGSCGACQLGDDQKDVHLVAKNKINACVGDVVSVTMPSEGVLSAAFIMYVVPLVGMFLGMFIGQLFFKELNNGEVYSALLGLLVMVGAFAIIKLNEKRFLKSEKYTAQILSIVQHQQASLVRFD